MVIISEIVTVIKEILALKTQYNDNNDAYDILRTALEINIPVLERLDQLFSDQEESIPARETLHKVVDEAQSQVVAYQTATVTSVILSYNKTFAKLTTKFQLCIATLTLLASFPQQERQMIQETVKRSQQSDTIPKTSDSKNQQSDTVPKTPDSKDQRNDTIPKASDSKDQQSDTIPETSDSKNQEHIHIVTKMSDSKDQQSDTIPKTSDSKNQEHIHIVTDGRSKMKPEIRKTILALIKYEYRQKQLDEMGGQQR
jgi:hypothetical protein